MLHFNLIAYIRQPRVIIDTRHFRNIIVNLSLQENLNEAAPLRKLGIHFQIFFVVKKKNSLSILSIFKLTNLQLKKCIFIMNTIISKQKNTMTDEINTALISLKLRLDFIKFF